MKALKTNSGEKKVLALNLLTIYIVQNKLSMNYTIIIQMIRPISSLFFPNG